MWIEVKESPAPAGGEYSSSYYAVPGVYYRNGALLVYFNGVVTGVSITPTWVLNEPPGRPSGVSEQTLLQAMDRMTEVVRVMQGVSPRMQFVSGMDERAMDLGS